MEHGQQFHSSGGFTNGSRGYFAQPELKLKYGMGYFEFDTKFYPNVSNNASPIPWTWTGFTGFTVMSATLMADAGKVAMGFPTYKTHFGKNLYCNGMESSSSGGSACSKKDPAATGTPEPSRKLTMCDDDCIVPASLSCEHLDVPAWNKDSPDHNWTMTPASDTSSVEFAVQALQA